MAAGVAWTAGTTLSGDSDVFNAGVPTYAYDLNNSAQSVNGVSFTGSNSQTALGTDVTLSGFDGGNYPGFGTGSAPFNNLSSAYKAVLTGGDYANGGTPVTFSLNNLSANHIYSVQYWADDSRSGFLGRYETLTSTGGNSQLITYTNTASAGGLGQYSLGYFTAGGATQALTARGETRISV
jgi:hypothetical protein